MQTERFSAQKIKCAGCVGNVRKRLLSLPGVDTVEVVLPAAAGQESIVTVQGTGLSREDIGRCLVELGYPVVG